jgi:hypothetical protein
MESYRHEDITERLDKIVLKTPVRRSKILKSIEERSERYSALEDEQIDHYDHEREAIGDSYIPKLRAIEIQIETLFEVLEL